MISIISFQFFYSIPLPHQISAVYKKQFADAYGMKLKNVLLDAHDYQFIKIFCQRTMVAFFF
jgi:hypothetical protein